MNITITIGWTKSRVVDGHLVYSSFSGFEHGEQQHTETITVDVPQDLIDDTRFNWLDRVAECVYEALNSPSTWTKSSPLVGEIQQAIAATGYRGQGAHYSLSTGDTVTIGNILMECESVGFRQRLSHRDWFLFTEFLTGASTHPTDNRRNALAIRMGRDIGCEEDVVAIIKAKRRERLTRLTVWQRKWGARTSRRPQRGRHHDSWAIREAYVRADGSHYSAHIGYGHTVRADHGIDDHPYRKQVS